MVAMQYDIYADKSLIDDPADELLCIAMAGDIFDPEILLGHGQVEQDS
jgi:hypothetical protein